jgi:photosynthetic reaction center cytochrome c subunit
MKTSSRRTILVAMGILTVCFSGITISSGQRGQEAKPQMSEELFKNVQVLRGIPVDEFMDTMGMISAALGLNCLDCHTSDSDTAWERFAVDTAMKRTSRRMIQMVAGINKDNFGGARGVTCWTCHRGDLRPSTLPNLTVQYSAPVEDPNDIQIRPGESGPPADQVFDKYFQALGGIERLNNLTSFTAKGTYTGFDTHHTKVPVEIFAKAPNQRTVIIHAAFADRVSAYNGREGWVAAVEKPLSLMPMTGGNLEGQKIEAMMAFPAQIKQAFNQWRVSTTSIEDKDVRVLQGTNPRQLPLNLYFDDTGLLVRMVRLVDTPIGRVPTQIDYSDYRVVAGVKVPFRWISTWTDGQVTIELTDVQPNVAIDASKFDRPAPAQVRK